MLLMTSSSICSNITMSWWEIRARLPFASVVLTLDSHRHSVVCCVHFEHLLLTVRQIVAADQHVISQVVWTFSANCVPLSFFFSCFSGGRDSRHKSFFGETDAIRLVGFCFIGLFVSTFRDCRHVMMQDVALRAGDSA